MHYRNGREAHNGDKIVMLGSNGAIVACGILFDAKPGNDYCNGSIAPMFGGQVSYACMCDCLHQDDLAAVLAEKGLDKRPPGK
ncbi:MAG TPA: hypothetical protein VGU03_10955 [Frateuria sp.]|uniref:hypothetical protein n=1 Tax=Frateuria sp. TaxID=2211372 RepID=UPI002DE69A8C|nr:hypothetical protein [Frateuria sp.]